MSAGQPARIYRTIDGGQTWSLCFEHPDRRSFFDALSFWDERHGIAMSDPIQGRLVLIETSDGGKTWQELSSERNPEVEAGEAGFAGSGTNMCVAGEDSVYIALGGALPETAHPASRIVYSHDRGKTWSETSVPIPRTPSSGIFSITILDEQRIVAVGGDYSKPESSTGNCAVSDDSIQQWNVPERSAPRGYRSCVARVARGKSASPKERLGWLVAVGPNGTELTQDRGNSWQAISDTGFHAVHFTADGTTGWATGADGAVAKWIWQE
jgi:photosystem II stability/assembly factor-like uncharacterized protein